MQDSVTGGAFSRRRLTIVQVHTADQGGGAELVAAMLHREFRAAGHGAYLLVGRKKGHDQHVIEIPQKQRFPGQCRIARALEARLGMQYLYAPGSHRLLELIPEPPDIFLFHSLHSNTGYFDLGALPKLTKRCPSFLYLHDLWTITGHCAHPGKCDRWLTGCGSCPDLTIYPRIPTDGTRWNWRRKRRLFRRCRLHIGSPANWVLSFVSRSPLLAAFPQFCIPNGVDTTIFQPGSRSEARKLLGLPLDRQIILFLANHGPRSPFKDFDCLVSALRLLREQGKRCLLLTVGGDLSPEMRVALNDDVIVHSNASDRLRVAQYYRAADLYCHATKADVYPLTILEAMACGIPVVASRVGGIPEMIEDGVTGCLVQPGDAHALAETLLKLISSPDDASILSVAAARHVVTKCSMESQANRFLDMFQRIASGTP